MMLSTFNSSAMTDFRRLQLKLPEKKIEKRERENRENGMNQLQRKGKDVEGDGH